MRFLSILFVMGIVQLSFGNFEDINCNDLPADPEYTFEINRQEVYHDKKKRLINVCEYNKKQLFRVQERELKHAGSLSPSHKEYLKASQIYWHDSTVLAYNHLLDYIKLEVSRGMPESAKYMKYQRSPAQEQPAESGTSERSPAQQQPKENVASESRPILPQNVASESIHNSPQDVGEGLTHTKEYIGRAFTDTSNGVQNVLDGNPLQAAENFASAGIRAFALPLKLANDLVHGASNELMNEAEQTANSVKRVMASEQKKAEETRQERNQRCRDKSFRYSNPNICSSPYSNR